ncbi:2-oxoglutarate dehydrogenase E1 component [Dictyobacter alpinus]|uniref:oxoglutarate dehydrogenase (succinyl-transferring) n=1 Tax=Dictyobacter alpinus TaxID=2014873 RepID=A0A402AZV0_9CHLR|nr:2-oxoglutarate dehydrogenase E1 component [Dictyobacter alpinus]GCE24631.1 2-oxoglutarate dehydrogenase E1 component [Dictyobacter alpinus]
MQNLERFYGPNAGYVLELYERYQQDPTSVDAATRTTFDSWKKEDSEVAPKRAGTASGSARPTPTADHEDTPAYSRNQVIKIVAASTYAHAIREKGHLGAHLDPLGSEPLGDPALLPETYGLSEQDLEQLSPRVVGGHAAEGATNAREAFAALKKMYSGTISYEFDQVKSPDERRWLRDAVGLNLYHRDPRTAEAYKLLKRLTQVEAFESYLHQSYTGQKRFSIEGIDMLVPMLDEIISGAVDSETKEVVIGMAHRGRLNVLAHVLGKPYGAIFAEFSHAKHEEGVPLTDSFGYGWTGDVKYHLGAEHLFGEGAAIDLKVILSPNPSHLEFVNPVIGGMARASQEIRTVAGAPLQDVDKTLPILIHGDAAFPGEGVVAETMNLWHLRGYWVGGTIHIIANNQLGFTTDPEDSRSTPFASDLAKGFSIPIIHVNADDPFACLTAVRIAHAYRDQFHKDVVIDLVGYRRWGHNEGDEPAFTQPQMYAKIRNHPKVRELYAQLLEQRKLIEPGEAEKINKDAIAELERAKREADEGVYNLQEQKNRLRKRVRPTLEPAANLSGEQLTSYNEELLSWPKSLSINTKLARILQRRGTTFGPDGGIDWGQAEALAFASILAEGTAIRLTGQDVERGTFSHRNAVLHSEDNDDTYIPLQHLMDSQASFSIYNSPLSEVGALGFEYGYSVHAPNTLVVWEAQFGDFSNVAQVIIDQFIASGRAKWKQDSSVVMLLPHGYEGQGPEHSSARLERYLQLAAQDNWRVANCSTAAQYYHLLRLQAHNLKAYPRPLVIMTPKALLRNPQSASRLEDLAKGTFQSVINDQQARQHPNSIRRVVLCTGKIAIDLLARANHDHNDDIAIVRVEMLYPFPGEEIKKVLENYPQAREIIWVQEEPKNMGAWSYMAPRLAEIVNRSITVDVISRPERSSPAAGFWDLYIAEQEKIITEASSLSLKQPGGNYVR